MKKIASLSILVLAVIYFSACQDDDSISPTDVSNTLITGTWNVSHFSKDEDDETSSFTGYEFIFTVTSVSGTGSGLVEASNGASDVVGSWSAVKSDKSTKLTLNFGITPFDELNEDWHVTERTDTQIKLEHVSGGNGGTDLLTLEKM